MRFKYLASSVVLLAASLAGAQVFDQAGMFAQSTVDRANVKIDEVHRKTGYDFRVETYAAMPADLRAKYDNSNKDEKVFREWAGERAKATKLRGMILLITLDPKHVRGEVGEVVRQQAFTLADRDRLVTGVIAELKANHNDEALTAAVDQWSSAVTARAAQPSGAVLAQPRVQQSAPPVARTAPRSEGFGVGPLICIAVSIVLLFVVIRSLLARRNNFYNTPGGYGPPAGGYAPGGYPQQSSGGGFFSSLLGGLVGGAAGAASYDYMTGDRNRGSGNYASPDQGQPAAPQQPDFSSDFNNFDPNSSDPGGGGDFGSSDSSSSFDSGGGGGGDSGGGGGDF